MKRLQYMTLVAGMALLLSACVQQVSNTPVNKATQLAVSAVKDAPITFQKGSRFALDPKYLKHTSLTQQQLAPVYHSYGQAIAKSLTEQGFQQTSIEKADFTVGYAVALEQDLNDATISEKFGITPGLHASEKLKKGSFLIYVADAASEQRLWRATAQGFVQESLNESERKTRSHYIVNQVLSQLYLSM